MSDKRGFSLIETIVALAIFFFVVTTVLLVHANGYASYVKINSKAEVEENLRIALNKMSRNIRQARSVRLVADNPPKIEVMPADGNDVYGYRYDRYGREIEENTGGVFLPIASHVTILEFTYDQADRTVNIKVKGEKGNSGIIEMSTMVLLREWDRDEGSF